MTILSYSLFTFMIYSMVFLLVYLNEIICDYVFFQNSKAITILKGGLLGLSLSLVIYFVHILNLTGLPDGRFSVVLLSVSFFGPIAGVLTGLIVIIASLLFDYYEISFLVVYVLINYFIGFIIFYKSNKTNVVHLLMNVIASISTIGIISLIARFLIHDALVELKTFQSYIYMVLGLNMLFNFSISLVLLREKNRSLTIKDQIEKHEELTQMNQEILYLNQQLIEGEKKYRLVLKASNEGFIEYDHRTKLLELSERALEICDYMFKSNMATLNEAFGVLEEKDALLIKNIFLDLKQNDDKIFTIRLKVKQREETYKHVLFNGILTREDGVITGVVGSIVDISEQVEKEEVINRLAYYDEITGLHNENAYLRDLSLALHEGNNGNLLFFSLVGYLNLEIMGQAYQNLVRMHISIILKRLFSEYVSYQLSDGCYCVVFMEEHQKKTVAEYFDMLKEELTVPFHLKDVNIPIQINSIYFQFPLRLIDAEGFLSRAKSALIQLQKNKIFSLSIFDEEKHSRLVRSNRIENHIVRSLEENEFHVVFQPQVANNQQYIMGYEALIRWDSKEFGNISPSEFIPIAERNGTIIKIGQFVLGKVCQFIKAMQKAKNQSVKVSINVSFLELVNPSFAINFKEYIYSQEVNPKDIAIEITETAIAEYLEIVQINIRILRSLGFEVHLDDFGTGYSSLNHITTIKIDCLKIDKSFIDKITVDETTLRVVESLIILSHNIGIKVIAEGVETLEQLDVLKGLQCDYFQGYYFSKPLKSETILVDNFEAILLGLPLE